MLQEQKERLEKYFLSVLSTNGSKISVTEQDRMIKFYLDFSERAINAFDERIKKIDEKQQNELSSLINLGLPDNIKLPGNHKVTPNN